MIRPSLTVLAFFSAAGACSAAHAESSENLTDQSATTSAYSVSDVVVTGSNIRRANTEGFNPVR
jgi:iron complex outermembrane receptor protein